jgi:hypothetical protein
MTYGTDLTYADLQEALVYWLNRFQPPPDNLEETEQPAMPTSYNQYGPGYFDYLVE